MDTIPKNKYQQKHEEILAKRMKWHERLLSLILSLGANGAAATCFIFALVLWWRPISYYIQKDAATESMPFSWHIVAATVGGVVLFFLAYKCVRFATAQWGMGFSGIRD